MPGARLDVSEQLKVILEEFDGELVTLTEETMRGIAKETAQRIKTEAHVKKGLHDTGEYASGWTQKKKGKKGKINGYVVYNRKKPGLTMLLEFGHVIRNKQGTYGRTTGIPHIKPAETWAQGEIMRRLGHRLGQIK